MCYHFLPPAPSDYTSVSMDLTFNSGTTNQTVMIPIVGDNVVESTESFTVSLTTGDSAVTLNPSTTTVTIQDDDGDDSKFWCMEQRWEEVIFVSDDDSWLSTGTNVTDFL